ncbi:hypothetical protein CDGHABPJ_00037 [Pseudomonas phage OMKO1]|nr:hypothetical protein CDGHABPJ_00037 [Pseudomonas phage OMKO1]WNV47948.1 hypothetical protein [Pseudomonas phage fMGyn-Pae01]
MVRKGRGLFLRDRDIVCPAWRHAAVYLMTPPDKEGVINDVAYVYCLFTKEGKVYVGSARDLVKRVQRHFRDLSNSKHHNYPLQQEYDNGERFSLKYYRCESRESAFTLEQMWITKHEEEGNLLNIGRHSKGGDNLTRHNLKEQIIEKRSDTIRIRLDEIGAEARQEKYGRLGEQNGMYGRTHTEEVKVALSELHTGNTYRLGIKASDETRARMSEIASQRTGERNPFYGKTHSEETRKKLTDNKRGIKPTNSNKLEVDGVVYLSQADAAKALGVSQGTITYRINSKNPKYSGYKVI